MLVQLSKEGFLPFVCLKWLTLATLISLFIFFGEGANGTRYQARCLHGFFFFYRFMKILTHCTPELNILLHEGENREPLQLASF
jgi:hypothetical protein